jgi:putative Ca2+/H+ antiporter (TMEM165/GDT1 family)
MKYSRLSVYGGAMLANAIMTLLSALIGNIATKFLPHVYVNYLSALLFIIFGLKMVQEARRMSSEKASEEFHEASDKLNASEAKHSNRVDLEGGGGGGRSTTQPLNYWCLSLMRKYVFSSVFIQAFGLTFLAEWGDRSQVSTFVLGARENMLGTFVGGTLGHAVCTAIAVLGGRFISQRISIRLVTFVGAFVFLLFAFSKFLLDDDI